jgi:hypothetical protein
MTNAMGQGTAHTTSAKLEESPTPAPAYAFSSAQNR